MRKSAVVLCAVAGLGAVAVLLVPATVPEVSQGDTAVTGITVNDGRTVELGPGQSLTFPIAVTATDDSGIRTVDPIGVWGPNYGVLRVGPLSCAPIDPTGTAARCTGTVTATASARGMDDEVAGTWFVDLRVRANDGDRYVAKAAAGFSLKRTGRLEDTAVSRPAAPDAPATVSGRLLRASWERNGYLPQQGVWVDLQFRPDGSDTWTTVTGTSTDGDGRLSTEVHPTGPGEYQWYSPGDKWTGAAFSQTVRP